MVPPRAVELLPVSPSGACWSTESRTPHGPLGYILSSASLGLLRAEGKKTTAFTERRIKWRGGGKERDIYKRRQLREWQMSSQAGGKRCESRHG